MERIGGRLRAKGGFARVEALAQVLIQARCAPASPRSARAGVTGLLASGLNQAFEILVLVGASSDAPLSRVSTVLDNAVALFLFGIASSIQHGAAAFALSVRRRVVS